MPRTRRSLIATLVVTLLLAGSAQAARLAGHVRAADGAGVPHLALEIRSAGTTVQVVTGPAGRLSVEGLAAGEYALVVVAPGFDLEPSTLTVSDEADTPVELLLRPASVSEHVVVSATRQPAAASTLGVSTSVIDAERLGTRRSPDLVHVLEDAPGLSVARAGGVGGQASAFLRGGESDFARVLVDGVPVNEPGGAYNLGTQLPLELERVEVVRGAASTLYGTDALAGVVHIVTRRAAVGERPSLRGEGEGGSFDWQRLAGGSSGRAGAFDWNAGALWLRTDNEEPNSDFEQAALAAAFGGELSERTRLRFVVRGETSDLGTPGPTAFGRPDLDARYERTDAVVSGRLEHAAGGSAHALAVSWAKSDQLSLDPEDSGAWLPTFEGRQAGFESFDFVNPEGFQNDTERYLASYQAEVSAGAHLLSGGLDVEHEKGALGDRREDLLTPTRTNVGAFAQGRLLLARRWFVTLGGRVEHNGSFGTQAVPRAAVAWQVRGGSSPTTLRTSAGLGIKEPSFFESFGTSFFAQGNPDLEPERSRTFEVGIEQYALEGRLVFDAAFYHHDYRDQIAYQLVDPSTFQGTYVNLGRTRARGLELGLRAAPVEGLRLRARYALLDGEILESASAWDPLYAEGASLLRRPRHSGGLGADYAHGGVRLGADLVLVGSRADSDFHGLGLTRNEGYARLDARLGVDVAPWLEAFLVGENLTDRQYMEVLGYPALGRSVRVGLRLDSRE